MESHLDLDALPRPYRIGLRSQDLGADDDLIGDCLGIDPAGVSTLIEIGRQKLAAEQRGKGRLDLSDPGPGSPSTTSGSGDLGGLG
jgi:hypothetical protein